MIALETPRFDVLARMIPLDEIVAGVRFMSRVPSFLRHRLTVEEAQRILRDAQEHREVNFLSLLRRGVYDNLESPYRKLLDRAGCEYGDIERLVAKEGLEATLHVLYRHGVYLTLEEFKGRKPVVRGNMIFDVNPSRLRNPAVAIHMVGQTSGSRGAGTPVPINLATIRASAVDILLALDAMGGVGWHHALWSVPGVTALRRLLRYSVIGATPVRWFSHVDAAAAGLHARYRWSNRALRIGSLLGGVRLPQPQHVPLDDPTPIVHWMAGLLRSGKIPNLYTYPSSAVCLSRAAIESGISLRGARLQIGGEPITPGRLVAIQSSGAQPVPSYGAIETGGFGRGCLSPEAPDDIHLLDHRLTVIQPGADGSPTGLPPLALLTSLIQPTARLILINVSLGDQAIIVSRNCGCPIERLGWKTHLHTVRSFEKLTAGGMTFLDADMVRVLDEVLPARFGGSAADYQLLEETDNGKTELRLLVHPRIGPLSSVQVAETFFTEISRGSGVERVTGLMWRDAGLLKIERLAPHATPSGKILHLHVTRTSRASLENFSRN